MIVVAPMSCNVNDVQDMDTEGDIDVLQPLDDGTQMPEIIANMGYTIGYKATAELANQRNLRVAKSGEGFANLPKKLHSNYSWQEADEILREEFKKVMGDDGVISDEERRLTRNIQYKSLLMLNQMGNPSNSSSEGISKSAAYYIKILYAHKANDLNRMADALVLAKPALDNTEFTEIRQYLIEKADQQTAKALENFDQWNQEYNLAVDKDEKRKWQNALKRLKSMTDEAEYVRVLLAENKK